jgi:uncharacterized protein YjiS (DUF1127 family)
MNHRQSIQEASMGGSLATRFMVPSSDHSVPGEPAGSLRGKWPKEPRLALLSAMLRAAWRRHRSRSELARLDGDLLKDIGISYAEAEYELNKPFWRP